MPINLTTPFTFSNGTRLVIKPKPSEDEGYIEIVVQVRSALASNVVFAERTGFIRNGLSSRFSRVALGTSGQPVSECLTVNPGFSTPTGFTQAQAALATGRASFEAFLLSSGILDSSLAGT